MMVPQPGDGFLNFTSIRREHSGWYKCTSRHLNFQYSSIGYYLSVRYTPSFAISRTPGFGYPLREGIEVSLKCDVDSNPPSTPVWQKDDGDTPLPTLVAHADKMQTPKYTYIVHLGGVRRFVASSRWDVP
uniref:Uncharacterized protein n=1 Tax=Phlebotomus papatasi TaxID=29031 RepID=A0A1B0DPA1_PHLPP